MDEKCNGFILYILKVQTNIFNRAAVQIFNNEGKVKNMFENILIKLKS